MRLLIAQINPIVGDLIGNTKKIQEAFKLARKAKVELVLCPELCLTGYPPEDFLHQPHFISATEQALKGLIADSYGLTAIVGLPRSAPEASEKALFNSAAILQSGALQGYHDKLLLPTYDVFDERRYFEPGEGIRIWDICGKKMAITICEDVWQHSTLLQDTKYRRDPIAELALLKPDLVLNLSASPFNLTNLKHRLKVGERVAQTLKCPVALCNQVGGNDSLIFDGHSYLMGSSGNLLELCAGYREHLHIIDPFEEHRPFDELLFDPLEQMYEALVLGIRDYFHKSGFKRACLGLSGGIDSALVAALAAQALGAENILGVGLPSRYTSHESLEDAQLLARNLNISYQQISIEAPFEAYLELLKTEFSGISAAAASGVDTTEENLQARIRGMILMAISNKYGYIVLNTGNKSELAVGYVTLYGDMCGGAWRDSRCV